MTDARPGGPDSPLAIGDHLASTGQWTAAIDAWERAADPPQLRQAVERRLVWFLAETGQPARPALSLALVLVFLAATTLGVACIALAGEPGTTRADLWATAAWAMTGIAMVSALVAAKRSTEGRHRDLIERARRVASTLDPPYRRGEPD